MLAALVQIAGGPGSPMGQLLLAGEAGFAAWMAARRPEDVEALWRLFSHNRAGLLRHISLEAFLADWFWGDADARADDGDGGDGGGERAAGGACGRIRREDAAEFLSYVFWGSTRAEVEALPGGAAALESKLAALEAAAGCAFAPGAATSSSSSEAGGGGGRRIMAHLREPLRVSYRPAVLYGLTELLSVAKRLNMSKRGFRKIMHPLFAIYLHDPCVTSDSSPGPPAPVAVVTTEAKGSAAAATEVAAPGGDAAEEREAAAAHAAATAAASNAPPPPPPSSPTPLPASVRAAASGTGGAGGGKSPIVFLHGIGIGLLPYQRFLDELAAACPDRPLVALEYKHVSMRLTGHVPSVDEMAVGVSEALAALGYGSATLVGHSYGTLVASRFSKLFPHKRLGTVHAFEPGVVIARRAC
ncbi:hypothetical protein GPECTOR_26g526 [Gonium pectorale]|uniref:AB hydrolase-1 domain-containing protein n=1 Tax=Gonium pectorale TaxID=33097 RepID=A0A150GFR3_GONPE|nr:hypothetical protein GPECTOR_26g526 [Gonium pectorale]|eukprot:KXZ48623.1 hypothetical protein GPECTOR_26g526 [Gonium pectorale]